VISDAIMVKVCKVDPTNGSADFQTYIFGVCGLGGIVGSIVAIFLTDTTNPRTTFFYYSFCHLLLILFVIPVTESDREDISILENFRACIRHLYQPVVYKTCLYLFMARALVPNFGDVTYYFIINEIGFSKSLIACLTLAGYLGLFFGSGLYNKFFKHYDYPKMMLAAQFLMISFVVLNLGFVTRVT
jgi:predicted MFS family arabinose efflux permease